jgi:hypothetical protein
MGVDQVTIMLVGTGSLWVLTVGPKLGFAVLGKVQLVPVHNLVWQKHC